MNQKFRFFYVFSLLFYVVSSYSCGGGSIDPSKLLSIIVTPVNPSIAFPNTKQFKATGVFSDDTSQDITSSVTWSSGNTSVSTINNSGLASSVATGTTTITATINNLSNSTTLTVTAPTPPPTQAKNYLGGSFTLYNQPGLTNNTVRISGTGTLDKTFSPGTGFDSDVYTLAVQSNEKILVGGYFSSYNDGTDHSVGYIARLNSDGTFDNTFTKGTGFDSPVVSIAPQSNGKILVGGYFSSYNDGTDHSVGYIARLNSDGTFDNTFTKGTGFDSPVVSIAPQSNGKILVGGYFSSYNDGTDHSVGYIARLNSDGTFDSTFSPGAGFDGSVYTLAIQGNGKIIVGGAFTSYNDGTDHSVGNIARLNSDGTFDNTFSPGAGFDGSVYTLAIQGDGKIIAGGSFSSYNDGIAHSVGNIARLNSDGTFNNTFSPGTGFDSDVYTLAVQSNEKILVGGYFSSYNDGTDHSVGYIARLNSDGTFDNTFSPGAGFDNDVNTVTVQGDGKIIVGGAFISYNDGTTHSLGRIVRLNSDGTFDNTFSPGAGFDGSVDTLAIQGNGKIIVGGFFSSYNDGTDHSVGNIARLNSDGTFDSTFSPGAGFDGFVETLAIQGDGKIIVGGAFSSYNDGTDHSLGRIARLNSDGTFDDTFSPGTGFGGTVLSLAIQTDGDILAGGAFSSYNDGTPHSLGRIARLNSDGTFDNTFSPGTGFNNNVNTVTVQGDGKIIVGGAFTSYNDGTPHSLGRIARLNSDGTFDDTFSPGTGFGGTVLSLAIQTDGDILAGGAFSSYNDGTPHSLGRIARLNSDGTFDDTFSPGTGFGGTVLSLAIQTDGDILAGGAFSSYNDGTTHSLGYVAKLSSDGSFIPFTYGAGTGFDDGVYAISSYSE
jgi:uncharacterized delta-60 repeat protein